MSAVKKQRNVIKSDFVQFDDVIAELQNYDFHSVSFFANVSTSTLYNWVNGRVKSPHMRTFINVANAIGFDVVLVRKSVRKDHRLSIVK